MNDPEIPRAVVDSNAVFEGLTKRHSASGLLIDTWIAGLFVPCISVALATEYVDVLSRKLSSVNWKATAPILAALLNLSEQTEIYFSWRPTSPDPGDDMVIDCAMNANAVLVTSNVRHFERAVSQLGLMVMKPTEFLALLDEVLPD
jgi:predicted nucleic acid-binding protein